MWHVHNCISFRNVGNLFTKNIRFEAKHRELKILSNVSCFIVSLIEYNGLRNISITYHPVNRQRKQNSFVELKFCASLLQATRRIGNDGKH